MPSTTPSWEALSARIVRDLGGGMVDVELTPENLNDAIDEALKEFRATASPATKEGYRFLTAVENERFYSLPDYIIDVSDIMRVGAGVVSGIEGLQYGAFLYQSMQSGQPFDLLSYHMTQSFIETLNTLTAADPAYLFHSGLNEHIGYMGLDSSEEAAIPDILADANMEGPDAPARLAGPVLELLQLPKNSEDVMLLEVRYARTDAELINDMDTGPWIHHYSRACAKIVLGMAYRKFDGMPGPGGGLSLPGSDLISEGKEEQEILKQDLLDLKYGEEAYCFMMG